MKTSIIIRIRLLLIIGLLILIINSCKKDIPVPVPIPGLPVTDIEGNVYKTVIIGTQTWMAENLRTCMYSNGDDIFHGTDQKTWSNSSSLKGAFYGLQDDYLIRGNLYNWYAVNNYRGLAPKGWHIASKNDWQILIDYLGGEKIANRKLQDTRTKYWHSGNSGATNETGFSAVQCGFVISFFRESTNGTNWWTSTKNNNNSPWTVVMFGTDKDIYGGGGSMNISDGLNWDVGFSVRCIKDN